MTFEDQGAATSDDEVVESPEASGEPIQPPAALAPVPTDYSSHFTTLNQQLRRLESRFDRGDPLIRQEVQSLRSQLSSLGTVIDEVNDLRSIVEVLVPEEHREGLQRQRAARQERSKLENRIHELETRATTPFATPDVAPPAQPDHQVHAAFLSAQASIQSYAEALGINLQALNQQDLAEITGGIQQPGSLEDIQPMVGALKQSLRKFAQKAKPEGQTPAETQAETRAQVRQQTTGPAARAAAPAQRKSFKTEAEWRAAHVAGEIDNETAMYWRSRNLPYQ